MARILVVDDEPKILDLLREILGGLGHSTISALDGEDGFWEYKTGQFDLVISDFKLTDINGGELAVMCKTYNRSVPFLVWTATLPEKSERTELYSAVDSWLEKPCSVEKLKGAVNQLLKNPQKQEV